MLRDYFLHEDITPPGEHQNSTVFLMLLQERGGL